MRRMMAVMLAVLLAGCAPGDDQEAARLIAELRGESAGAGARPITALRDDSAASAERRLTDPADMAGQSTQRNAPDIPSRAGVAADAATLREARSEAYRLATRDMPTAAGLALIGLSMAVGSALLTRRISGRGRAADRRALARRMAGLFALFVAALPAARAIASGLVPAAPVPAACAGIDCLLAQAALGHMEGRTDVLAMALAGIALMTASVLIPLSAVVLKRHGQVAEEDEA